ncbi:MAG: adenylate cyclase, partial [bacterium]
MLKKIFKMSGLKLSFLITFVFAGMFFWNLINPTGGSFIEVLDLKFIDFIMKSRGTIRHGNEVVIAAVDTKAVDKYGRWPWSRDKMAILVKALNNHYKAKVIGFDIVFSESDNNYKTAKKIIDQYRKIENSSSNSITSRRLKAIRQNFAKNLNHDAKFGKELSSWENIVLGYFIWTSDEGIKHLTKQEKGKLEERVASSAISIIQGRHFLKDSYMPNRGVGVEPNIPLLAPSNSLHGALNFIPDFTDGIARRVHLLWEFNGEYYPNLDLQMLRRYYDNKPIRLISNESGVQEIRIGSKIISTAGDGSIYINYKGPSFTFSHYSVYDIINKTVPIEKLKGKIILVGGTETGIFDLRATPVGASFPGVEVHANVIENIIHDDYLSQDDLSKLVTLALILTLGILMGLVVPRVGAIVGVIFSLILLIGYVVADLWVFNHYNTWASFSYVTLVIILNWFAIILYRFLVEEKDKRFIQGAFKQYLSPDVIDRLVANPNLLKLGGERKELTAFFSDVQGFSTI